ncbi:hypothetical protein GCM10027160_41570 [Streptomyces calidiresistens]|uniref:Nuclear transport factor 2 family protein n=1 Tax=Streptomyces calidiresistens TaxID=1485586 RepID=A0A7W3XX34_9ACTN|nr:nuclear transport factor 2 family protein [Streptomyces calidiresistens]
MTAHTSPPVPPNPPSPSVPSPGSSADSPAAGTAGPLSPRECVVELWRRMEARDWSGLGALIAPDAVIDWPATGERIVGRSAFVAVNREYPEGWSIRVLDVLAEPGGERVVSEVEVPQEGVGVFRVASFWTVRGGLVVAGTEYWVTVGGDAAPAWRAPWTRPLPG